MDKVEKESRVLAVEELLVSGIGTARVDASWRAGTV
jgi:hypothetical protein